MIFPFEILGTVAREAGLVVAVVIGMAFGFVLERAGFGRADKLAAQFYFRDMTVFKVMFTAIVTAMLGLVAASRLGLADLRSISESIVSWTWIWPMLIGGLVLGVGFIISGYCPGTSLVAAASGNIDGAATVGGVVFGTFVYTHLLDIPSFAKFHESGAKEAWFLYDLIPISPVVIALAIAVMALLAFIGAERVESLFAGDRPPHHWRLAIPAFAVLALVMLIGGRAHRSPAPGASPGARLDAANVVAEPWRYEIKGNTAIDLASNVSYSFDPASMPKGTAVAAAPAARPGGTFTKPKKKGGGCSS